MGCLGEGCGAGKLSRRLGPRQHGGSARSCPSGPPRPTLGPVSPKIVLNGKEYDGVESMPPDVRKDYETVLESLQATGGDEVLSLLRSGEHANIKATFREIVVNGKSYGSVEEMPADVRKTYEEAVARMGTDASGALAAPLPLRPARPSRPAPQPPLAIE